MDLVTFYRVQCVAGLNSICGTFTINPRDLLSEIFTDFHRKQTLHIGPSHPLYIACRTSFGYPRKGTLVLQQSVDGGLTWDLAEVQLYLEDDGIHCEHHSRVRMRVRRGWVDREQREHQRHVGLQLALEPNLVLDLEPDLESDLELDFEPDLEPGLELDFSPGLGFDLEPGLELDLDLELGPELDPELDLEFEGTGSVVDGSAVVTSGETGASGISSGGVVAREYTPLEVRSKPGRPRKDPALLKSRRKDPSEIVRYRDESGRFRSGKDVSHVSGNENMSVPSAIAAECVGEGIEEDMEEDIEEDVDEGIGEEEDDDEEDGEENNEDMNEDVKMDVGETAADSYLLWPSPHPDEYIDFSQNRWL